MTQQAPALSAPIRILNVAANYISFDWDVVAENYTYLVYRKLSNTAWTFLAPQILKGVGDLYSFSEYFDENLVADTSYDYAVSVIGPGLTESTKTFLNGITTFATNAYSVQTANHVQLYDTFTSSRFELDDKTTTDNPLPNVSTIRFHLLRPSYVFNSAHQNIADADVAPHLLIAPPSVQIWGRAPNGCGGFGCSVPAILSDWTLVFDRKQKIVRISLDKGKNWRAARLLPDRAGDPYHENMYSHNKYGLFVLGWSTIMVIHEKSNVNWSNDGVHFSDEDVYFDGDEYKVDDLQFRHFANYPPGVSAGTGEAIGSDETYLYFCAAGTIYRCEIATKIWDIVTTTMPANFKAKEFVTYNKKVYVFCPGLGGCFGFDADSSAGIYDISSAWSTHNKVYGTNVEEMSRIHPIFSNLSRDDYGMIFGASSQHYDVTADNTPGDESASYVWPDATPPRASKARPIRDSLYFTGGLDANPLVIETRNERWQYEEQYLYNGHEVIDEFDAIVPTSWPCIRVNDTNYISVITAVTPYFKDVFLDDTYALGTTTITIDPDRSRFIGYPGYVNAAILYNVLTGDLIAFNSLTVKTRTECEFSWLLSDIVAKGVLQKYTAPVTEKEDTTAIPSLQPFAERFLPDHYSYREPKFVQFVREYLKYISDGSLTNYGQLYTMRSSHDANEPTVFIDMFESDLMRRNVYVNDETRARLNTFLYNTARDFYSVKGTVDSYKFLFRLLYGETVNVKVENTYEFTYEFDIIIGDKNLAPTTSVGIDDAIAIGKSIAGQKMFQVDSGGTLDAIISDIPSYCEITSVNYRGDVEIDGDLYPRYTVQTINSFGEFLENYSYGIDTPDYAYLCMVYTDPVVVPKIGSLNDYGKQFNFILRLESELPYSRYYQDVINFVHPVGFDFIGSYLLTSFITQPIPPDHIETIFQYSDSVRWDNGAPSVYPDFIPDLDINEEYQFSTQTHMFNEGRIGHLLKVVPHASAGLPFDAGLQYPIDNPVEVTPPYGLTVDQRRTKASPLFDGSSGRFFDRINNPDTNNAWNGAVVVSLNRCRLNRVRLKDNLVLPLDPSATQRKNVHL